MNKLEVADLIEQIPQELTPDEFLVALATKAAEWGKSQALAQPKCTCGRPTDLMIVHRADAPCFHWNPYWIENIDKDWVGLTKEEARAIRLKVGSAADEYAVAIEEALREKNGG